MKLIERLLRTTACWHWESYLWLLASERAEADGAARPGPEALPDDRERDRTFWSIVS